MKQQPLTPEERATISSRALLGYGLEHQQGILFEEMAELQDAICKHRRGRVDKEAIIEEIADVFIMTMMMMGAYGPAEVSDMIDTKLRRLRHRMDALDKAHHLCGHCARFRDETTDGEGWCHPGGHTSYRWRFCTLPDFFLPRQRTANSEQRTGDSEQRTEDLSTLN